MAENHKTGSGHFLPVVGKPGSRTTLPKQVASSWPKLILAEVYQNPHFIYPRNKNNALHIDFGAYWLDPWLEGVFL